MPYITREDGEHFVIPSYRDVLSAKQKSLLKKDILLLSQSYGEYITLQRKSPTQYEVAFSPDTGYLLGESIWHYFKRPLDMIYCEAIPNTTEAILVIVKAGSVYLDGTFPVESIPEELIIFLTQQNNFEIYTYGDVPISQTPTEGKFSFEANSVKSFSILEKPIFPTLPLLKIYQLQLVDQVLKTHGIGVFPTRQLIMVLVIIGLGWMFFNYLTTQKAEAPPPPQVNPYLAFNQALASPAPDALMHELISAVKKLFTLPGWEATKVDYAGGILTATVQSHGGSAQALEQWTENNNAAVEIDSKGVYVKMNIKVPSRKIPTYIYPIKQIIANFIDKLAIVYPGNNLRLNDMNSKGLYSQVTMTITVTSVTPVVLSLIGDQFSGLPFVLESLSLDSQNGSLSGSIILDVLGS